MLLTISTDHKPASDLGFLLHKHPDRVQSFKLSFGSATVFYPEADDQRCAACLLLDIDPVGMVRGRSRNQGFIDQYVNDRPYVASSFMSVAIAQVFSTAMAGRSKDRPDLAGSEIPLTANIDVLPVRGDADFVRRIFEPLGYTVEVQRYGLDDQFPEWGASPYYSVTLRGTVRLAELLKHLYVLMPVFDNSKHYYVGEDELEKLLAKAADWLAQHPEKPQIIRRYLRNQNSLFRQALTRLEDVAENADGDNASAMEPELERPLSLNEQRLGAVLASLRSTGARSVIDIGCGEGKLLKQLLADRQFEKITGMDVSIRALEIAEKRLKLERLPEKQAERIKLIQGSLMYRDKRFGGYDAAAVVEVIEHLDPPRLSAFESVLFEFARPKHVVLTTPNREYNIVWESLPAGKFRHSDHRFEWTREEFQIWAKKIADRFQYQVRFLAIGPEDEKLGSPTQMALFERD